MATIAVAHAALAAALALGAAEDVVGGHAEQARRRPWPARGTCRRPPRARQRPAARPGSSVILSVGIELELERRREAFELGIAGLAADDQRDDWPLGMPRLEEPDLLVDVVALGGGRRADDDQRGRGIERGKRLVGEGMARGEVVAVAEDGAERLGDRTRRGLAAHQVLVDGEGFERAVQPLRPAVSAWL